METNEEKTCRDCKYYIPHYAKVEGRYLNLLKGHCIHTKENGRFRKTDKTCECFSDRNRTEEKIKSFQAAKKILSEIIVRLRGVSENLERLENDSDLMN